MGQEQSYRPERLENPESDWNFLITDAIQHGWIIEKNGDRVVLEPPADFIYATKSAIWKKLEYMGRLVSVPDHILQTHIRHNVNKLHGMVEIDWNFLITDAIQHGWVIEKRGDYVGLEPPVNFLHGNCAAVWKKREYRGRIVTVPSHIERTFIRRNLKVDLNH